MKDLKKVQDISLRFWTTQVELIEEKQRLLALAEMEARADKEC